MRHLVLLLALIALPAQAAEFRPFVRGSAAAIATEKAGKPHVVAYWSLTCAPCIAEMPMWKKLVAEKGLDLVLVATDPIEDAPRLLKLLRRHDLDANPGWVFADAFVERLRFEIDRTWSGELPRTHFVGADGVVHAEIGATTEGAVTAWLAMQRRQRR